MVLLLVALCAVLGCGGERDDGSLEEWQKKTSTTVASQTYQDGEGNQIVYYCCKTTYEDQEDAPELWIIDQQALGAVIDWERAEEEKVCMVGEWPAVLCQLEGHSYLCWTISSEYSCVIRYDAGTVSEEDIFRMAASVVQQ